MPELSVAFDKTEYRPGDPIQVTFTLRNTEQTPVLVNGRLALNAPFAPPRYREVALTITAPSGQPLPFMAKLNLGGAQDKHFKLLQPGETVQHSYALRDYYRFDQPGAYTAEASYQNQAEPSQAGSLQPWKGELSAEPVSFTLQA